MSHLISPNSPGNSKGRGDFIGVSSYTAAGLTFQEWYPVIYDLAGIFSSCLFILSLSGLWIQWRAVWRRSREGARERGEVSRSLSLTHLSGSFFAFYGSLLYGIFTSRFNHYLVWTRLVACLLVFGILFLVFLDRRERLLRLAVSITGATLVTLPLLISEGRGFLEVGRSVASVVLFLGTIYLLHGFMVQIRIIKKSSIVGAVSKRSHQFLAIKDLGNVLFTLAMGMRDGLPLFLSFFATLGCRLLLLKTISEVDRLHDGRKL